MANPQDVLQRFLQSDTGGRGSLSRSELAGLLQKLNPSVFDERASNVLVNSLASSHGDSIPYGALVSSLFDTAAPEETRGVAKLEQGLAQLQGEVQALRQNVAELQHEQAMRMRQQACMLTVGQYNILAGYLGNNMEPWFLYGVELSQEQRHQIIKQHSERSADGKPKNPGFENYVRGVLDEAEQAVVRREHEARFAWPQRRWRLLEAIRSLDTDLLSLVECDHYDDFFEPELKALGYESIWEKRPRASSPDGCCIAWRPSVLELVARSSVAYQDRFDRASKDRIALFALMRFRQTGDEVIFISTHLARNPEEPVFDRLRARQVGQMVRKLGEFAQEHSATQAPVLMAADMNAVCFDKLRCIASTAALLKGDSFVHPFIFECQDVRTPPTSVTTLRQVRIDCIMYQGSRLVLLDVGAVPRLRADEVIPNQAYPSDHLPIRATFQLHTLLQRKQSMAQEWYYKLDGRGKSLPLAPEELQDSFESFDHNCDGRVTLNELCRCILELLGTGDTTYAAVQKVLSAHFMEDSLDFSEFARAYLEATAAAGLPGLKDGLLAFGVFDDDHNGTLELTEILTAFAECCPTAVPENELRELFLKIDADNNGVVTLTEFKNQLLRVWKRLFASPAYEALSQPSAAAR